MAGVPDSGSILRESWHEGRAFTKCPRAAGGPLQYIDTKALAAIDPRAFQQTDVGALVWLSLWLP